MLAGLVGAKKADPKTWIVTAINYEDKFIRLDLNHGSEFCFGPTQRERRLGPCCYDPEFRVPVPMRRGGRFALYRDTVHLHVGSERSLVVVQAVPSDGKVLAAD